MKSGGVGQESKERFGARGTRDYGVSQIPQPVLRRKIAQNSSRVTQDFCTPALRGSASAVVNPRVVMVSPPA